MDRNLTRPGGNHKIRREGEWELIDQILEF